MKKYWPLWQFLAVIIIPLVGSYLYHLTGYEYQVPSALYGYVMGGIITLVIRRKYE